METKQHRTHQPTQSEKRKGTHRTGAKKTAHGKQHQTGTAARKSERQAGKTNHRGGAAKGHQSAAKGRKWSGRVTATSNALDLESKVFTSKDPLKIARSLKRSAEKSKRRKGTPFQSAMSMLNFYINRAGRHLSRRVKAPLEKAKVELRRLFHKERS